MNSSKQQLTSRVRSIDEAGNYFPVRDLKIWFIAAQPHELQIKNIMKTSDPIKDKKNTSSLFHVAAQTEDTQSPAPVKAVTSLNKRPWDDQARSVAQTSPQKKRGGDGKKPARPALIETEFQLEAPKAVAVKLAADFTDWEKSPLDMTRSEDGVWHAVVPLPPGDHPYRFIVDGQWYDDPRPAMCTPNPFGTVNAVMRVA